MSRCKCGRGIVIAIVKTENSEHTSGTPIEVCRQCIDDIESIKDVQIWSWRGGDHIMAIDL